jgi:hypothetical protein
MKKIIAILLCMILCVGVLCGCFNSEHKYIKSTLEDAPLERVMYIGVPDSISLINPDIEYYRDKLTDVMYATLNRHYGIGLSVLVKSDGTPMLYDEWVELIDNYK